MKGGTKAQKNQGFTIVETLIVLAVTGLMFVIAIVYIGGRQNKAMFQESIQDVRSQILGVMSDVSNSVYAMPSNVLCTVSESGANRGLTIQNTPSAVAQGTNQNCVYMGKVLSFGVNGDNEAMVTDIAFGRRATASGQAPTSAAEAFITIANGHPASTPNVAHLSQGHKLRNGLAVHSMCAYLDNDSTCSRIAGLAVLISPWEQISYSSGQLNSGSLSPKVVALRIPTPAPITGVVYDPGVHKGTLYEIVDRSLGPARIGSAYAAPQTRSGGIRLCFASGTTDQSGLIVIGENDQGLTADLTIKGNKTCA